MQELRCETCWKMFKGYGDRKYCCRECWANRPLKYENRTCPICGEEFYPQTPTQKYCSHKCLWKAQQTKEDIHCLTCWKLFHSTSNKNYKFCCKECYTKFQSTIKENVCKNCWKEFKWKSNDSVFCCRDCWYEYYHTKEPIEDKVKRLQTLWNTTPWRISKPNLIAKELLEELWFQVELEFQIKDRFYDLKIWNTLIEINPWATHNSTRVPAFNPSAKKKDKKYHLDKLKLARDNWYRCIMVRDRDDFDKVTYLLDNNKQVIYARDCEIKEVSRKEAYDFFSEYHLQGDTQARKNNIYIWLFYKDNLVECMSFWKPRWNKKCEWEILRLCSHKDYRIVWWANRIFSHFLESTQANSVVSYCDMSKFDWKVYEQLWFKLLKWNSPTRHRYNDKETEDKKHITDNLLRQHWYDQLFNESHGKWTSNEELMLQRGYVEIYDCGQATFVRNK